MISSPKRLLIIGGSTRAAAWSAARAGFQPVCADLFADADTRQIAHVVPVRDYPRSLPDDVAHVRADGWLFTGALENCPDLLEQLDRSRASYGPMLGCSTAALRMVRDPFWVADTLRAAGHAALAVRRQMQPPPSDGSWLQKPIAGAGGRLIRVWNSDAQAIPLGEPHYFQKRAAGNSKSAVFWRDAEQFFFLGATQQLINLDSSLAADAFAYCGSVGPIQLPEILIGRLIDMARTLANASGLRGLFGIDFLHDGDTISLVELNPRYPASVEVLERASRLSIMSLYDHWIPAPHSVAADVVPVNVEPQATRFPNSHTIAKVVIYSSERFEVPDFQGFTGVAGGERPIELADIPVPGTSIDAGWPICTVLSSGLSIPTALENARRTVELLRQWLRQTSNRAIPLPGIQ